MRRLLLTSLSLTTLAACGGSSSSGNGPTTITVPAAFATLGDTDVQVEITASGDTIVVDKDGTLVPIATDTASDIGTYVTALDGSGDYTIAFVSQTDTSMAALAVYNDGVAETNGAVYQRIGTTDLPTTGSATFEGDYVGLLIEPSTQGSIFGAGFRGDASLDVSFEDGTVSGDITNRELIFTVDSSVFPDSSVADIALEETDLSETGTFAGDVTGGAFTVDADTSVVGAASAYEGLIAGTSATEAVGGTLILHEIDGDDFIELGSFAAGH